MSKGHVFLAQNADTDYVRQAYALALTIKKHNVINQTCLITNDEVPEEYRSVFDHIVPIPWSDLAAGSKWKIENRWKIIYATPFDENLVYDVDMLLLSSNDHWWKYFINKDVCFTSTVTDYRGDVVTSDYYRKTFTSNDLPNVYTGAFYFKKTDVAFEFFTWLELISKNWRMFYREFLKVDPQKFYSVDVSAALAVKFMNTEDSMLVNNTFIPSFVHMKPAIQGWKKESAKWSTAVSAYLDNQGHLKIGNYLQTGLFHYVEDEFLTDDFLTRLQNL
jgi:hypothetical protein